MPDDTQTNPAMPTPRVFTLLDAGGRTYHGGPPGEIIVTLLPHLTDAELAELIIRSLATQRDRMEPRKLSPAAEVIKAADDPGQVWAEDFGGSD